MSGQPIVESDNTVTTPVTDIVPIILTYRQHKFIRPKPNKLTQLWQVPWVYAQGIIMGNKVQLLLGFVNLMF